METSSFTINEHHSYFGEVFPGSSTYVILKS
jgi:hypothetical protein